MGSSRVSRTAALPPGLTFLRLLPAGRPRHAPDVRDYDRIGPSARITFAARGVRRYPVLPRRLAPLFPGLACATAVLTRHSPPKRGALPHCRPDCEGPCACTPQRESTLAPHLGPRCAEFPESRPPVGFPSSGLGVTRIVAVRVECRNRTDLPPRMGSGEPSHQVLEPPRCHIGSQAGILTHPAVVRSRCRPRVLTAVACWWARPPSRRSIRPRSRMSNRPSRRKGGRSPDLSRGHLAAYP